MWHLHWRYRYPYRKTNFIYRPWALERTRASCFCVAPSDSIHPLSSFRTQLINQQQQRLCFLALFIVRFFFTTLSLQLFPSPRCPLPPSLAAPCPGPRAAAQIHPAFPSVRAISYQLLCYVLSHLYYLLTLLLFLIFFLRNSWYRRFLARGTAITPKDNLGDPDSCSPY